MPCDARDRGQLAHDAVDPDPDEQASLLRREVDVGRAEVEGLRDRPVDEDDGRRVVVQIEDGRVVLRLVGVRDDVLDVDRGAVVELRDRELDRIGRCDADAHRHAESEAELVREHDVRRVGDRDEHVAVVDDPDRQRPVAAGEVLRQHHGRFDLDRREVELDELELVLLREHARDRRPGHEPVGDEDLAEADSGLRRFSASASSSCSGVTAPSRTRSVPSAGHGFLAASMLRVSAARLPWLRDISTRARSEARNCADASSRPARQPGGGDRRRGVRRRVRCRACSILLGVAAGDGAGEADRLARKVSRLRIFENDGREVRPLDRRRGRRGARRQPVHAHRRHDEGKPAGLLRRGSPGARRAALRALLRSSCGAGRPGRRTGVFGARMQIELVNDGPVTIVLDV